MIIKSKVKLGSLVLKRTFRISFKDTLVRCERCEDPEGGGDEVGSSDTHNDDILWICVWNSR